MESEMRDKGAENGVKNAKKSKEKACIFLDELL
jgi:hypothetical protein